MLYNIPGRTGRVWRLKPLLDWLKSILPLRASGSLDQVSQIRHQTPSDFAIYSGDDSLYLAYSVGREGVVWFV
jgi:4-hydroxy-tetrahydrodipicolinate synthase